MRTARRSGEDAGEQGAATLVLMGLVGAAVALSVALASVGSALVAQRRAGSSADLAALAAAVAVQDRRDGCAAAADLARLNHTRLLSCQVAGQTVTVRVGRPVRMPLLGEILVSSHARAGPVGSLMPAGH